MAIETELRELIERSFPRDKAREIAIFAERLFAHGTSAESLGAERRLAIAAPAFEFFAHRAEPIAVRVLPVSGAEAAAAVETVTADCPFIVDSLHEYFHSLGAPVRTMLHPVFKVARTADGGIASMEQANSIERAESFVCAALELKASPDAARRIEREVRAVLTEVHLATDDFAAMTARALGICEETAPRRDLAEVREFLRWLAQDGFVFLGYCRYRLDERGDGETPIRTETDSELGILRPHDESRFTGANAPDRIPAARAGLSLDAPPLTIAKTRIESIVHRRRAMDVVSIRRENCGGAAAFDLFLGLFTSKAYAQEAQHIPLLRAKLAEVIAAEGAAPGSHDYKEIAAAFNSFPKDELFRAPIPELRAQLRLILDVESETATRLLLVPDVNRGTVIALVVMPREAFSAAVRMRIQDALAAGLGGKNVYYYLALGEGYTARLHFCFAAPPPASAAIRDLQAAVIRIARSWEDRFRERLVEEAGPARGRELAVRWKGAFGAEYQAVVGAARAARDAIAAEELAAGGRDLAAEVRPATAGAPDAGEIRMIGLGEPPMLSELMPALRNFGIEVIAEDAHELHPAAGGKIARAYVQAFSVRGADGRAFSELPGVALLADALLAVRAGTAEDDPLNALTPAAGLAWRETALLRAYLAAAFQMRLAPSREALRRALLLYPELARKLFESFAARLSPDLETPADEIAALRAACTDRIAAIDNIGDDRNARALLSMVEATVRTNYFCKPPTPDSCIALKFESGRIAALPGIPPLYEIHVNSPRMEGCHLRAGKIARGGIRFSDRHDDYRVEILDLMKTQTVKNAIIVPTGAKGGFIVKPRRGGVRDPDPAVSAYRTLIGALLDLTDNLSAAGAAHPAGVKALDDDGAYLVVAADKGTAAFSDAANRIAIERGFWLGDAFASGGEHGYDHKKMGITARGAWESARRHLREMGRDPDRGAPITTIGIGDMSGDVFGNGLLQSRNVKLVAAFDHRHIFIDPDPDPAASFAERKRLFAMARSSWADYNPALIGRGGGVFRRGEKRIELSEPARAALGCEARALDGESLIAAILRAPADLLYNGGIGTYVRASDESNADADDRANDACRIAAAELRVKAVVEGGNLGFTQRARIEYALAGGRIDTDAIDNSAGVDLSDHEVNLKILLQQPMARGEMSFAERNALLTGCAEEVARGVIADNRDQALWLSLEQVRSRSQMAAFREHLRALESHRLPISDQAALPNRELLRERHARYPGLTRPELAAIGAYTKIDLSARLAAAPFIADPYLADRFLKPYFPAAIAERFGADIERHRLRRELIATRIANELVDLAGATFVFGLTRDFGGDAETAVRAWITGADLLSIRGRAAQIKSKEANAAAPQAELDACFALERASRGAARWALDRLDPAAPIAAAIARYRPGFDALFGTFEPMLAQGERDRFEAAQRELRRAGVDGELAHDLARLAFAEQLLEILDLAVSDRTDLERAAAAYFRLGGEIDFSRLEAALEAIAAGEDRWERRAAIELGAELRAARIAMCRALIERATDGLDAGIERLRRERETRFAEAVSLCAEMRTGAPPGIPALQVTIRSVSRLASGN